MNFIHSKDIYLIVRDVLKLLDPRTVNHGTRTAYILYKMLENEGKYEKYELAEMAMLATLHDIGAFKTDYNNDSLFYESKEYMPHSIYGYLFILYLTPFKDRAKIILYHHTEYSQLPKAGYEFDEVINCLNLAEKVDIYSSTLGSKFDYTMFQKHVGTKYSPKAIELLYRAQRKEDILARLSNNEYKKELDELSEYFIFTNEEKQDWIRGIMFCVAFRSEYTMVDISICESICRQLSGMLMLSEHEKEVLSLAAILHDAGMLAVPKEIIEAPRRLTDDEMQSLRMHVDYIQTILNGRLDSEVLDVISAHHERGDGSGYPNRLRDSQMNKLQKILQVADTITGLTSKRSYRAQKSKEQVIGILKEEADKGRLNKEIVKTFISFYDQIMGEVEKKSEQMVSTYIKLNENYEITSKKIRK